MIRAVLRRSGIFHRLKASAVYDLYWQLRDRSRLEEREREVAFYRSVLTGLPANSLVFDIGANRGDKTDVFLRLGARVVAVDPDETNQLVLRQKFLSYRAKPKPVTVVGKAVSDRNGQATFWISEPGFEMNTLSAKWADTLEHDANRFGRTHQFSEKREVETTTLDDLISTYGRPFYIKIDVEGHEISALRGLQQPVPYLSFEVNLPDFASEAEQCIDLLATLSRRSEFNYAVSGRNGLALETWLTGDAFRRCFSALSEASIEVFWRSRGASSPSE